MQDAQVHGSDADASRLAVGVAEVQPRDFVGQLGRRGLAAVQQLGEALIYIGESVKNPRICRVYLEQALTNLSRALSVAAVLDPEE